MTRVLIIHPGAIGDTLVALSVLDSIKRWAHPSHLTLIGHPALIKVLPGRTVVNEMRSIDRREFTELLAGFGGMSDPIKSFYQTFDRVVVWAHDQSREIGKTLSALHIKHHTVASPRLRDAGVQSVVQRLRATLPGLPPVEDHTGPWLRVSRRDQSVGADWLAANGMSQQHPVVAMHPGGGSFSKCWAPDRYAEVARKLLKQGVQVLVIEGPADEPMVTSVRRSIGINNVTVLSGEPLCTVMAVLSQCQGFLGNDSGIMHLATALGIPTIALFGPSDPRVWTESQSSVWTIQSEHPCACPTALEQRACMSKKCLEIPVETVAAAVQRRLNVRYEPC